MNMGNMIDYLEWRGDITLDISPFNEIDNLLLSCVSYGEFDGIVPVEGEGEIELCDVVTKFFELHSPEELKADQSFINWVPEMLRQMAKTDRFGHMILRNYINILDYEKELQFSAVEILPGDGTSFVSFKGTDDMIVAWKEDFNLSYRTIPADFEAALYLNRIHGQTDMPIRVGGHSKGGNLAVYASSYCYYRIRDRIEAIYCNDGPGFHEGFKNSRELEESAGKIRRYIPENSIIGMLLEHKAAPIIVESDETGLMQHNPVSWQVSCKEFVRREELGEIGKLFDSTFREWIGSVDAPNRMKFIEDMFSVLESAGTPYLSHVMYGGLKTSLKMTAKLTELDPASKEIIEKLIRIMLNELDTRRKERKKIISFLAPPEDKEES